MNWIRTRFVRAKDWQIFLLFVSKSLAIAETGKSAPFNEYAGAFFPAVVYPIGIWFIQRRINRLYAKRRTDDLSAGATAN